VSCPCEFGGATPIGSTTSVKRTDRARLYELAVAEGALDDVRRYVRLDQLIDQWPEVVLPRHNTVLDQGGYRIPLPPPTSSGRSPTVRDSA
jgi:hypothetical protein